MVSGEASWIRIESKSVGFLLLLLNTAAPFFLVTYTGLFQNSIIFVLATILEDDVEAKTLQFFDKHIE